MFIITLRYCHLFKVRLVTVWRGYFRNPLNSKMTDFYCACAVPRLMLLLVGDKRFADVSFAVFSYLYVKEKLYERLVSHTSFNTDIRSCMCVNGLAPLRSLVYKRVLSFIDFIISAHSIYAYAHADIHQLAIVYIIISNIVT